MELDGRPVAIAGGDSVALAILRAGEHPGHGGTLCLAGDCGSCVAEVDGVAYVRTYDVELAPSPSGASSLEAVVRHVHAFGPVVRLELDLVEGGGTIEAHIARDRFEILALAKGHRVYVSPTNVRVFAQP